jgi:pimeloyl-ACP methyl ester carboxylesterase
MSLAATIIGWVLCAILLLMAILTLTLGRIVPAILLILACVLVSPLFGSLFKTKNVKVIMYIVRTVLVLVLLFGFVMLSFIDAVKKPLYKTDQLKADLQRVYDEKMGKWPVPYEIQYVNCTGGKAFVVTCGPEDAPPVLLFHAASMGSWSWLYNIEELTKDHRVYAVDYIGEPGKGIVTDEKAIPFDTEGLNKMYDDIVAGLGITQPYDVIGASFGGFIAVNRAMHAPDEIKSVTLLGPMGITPATSSVNTKLMAYQLFPLKPFQKSMFHWALGYDPDVVEETEEWFWLVLKGITRKGSPPNTFTPEQLKEIDIPVLLVLGDKDGLVGDPQTVIPLAENVPNINIEILPSGHLIGMEKPEETNALIMEFLSK